MNDQLQAQRQKIWGDAFAEFMADNGSATFEEVYKFADAALAEFDKRFLPNVQGIMDQLQSMLVEAKDIGTQEVCFDGCEDEREEAARRWQSLLTDLESLKSNILSVYQLEDSK